MDENFDAFIETTIARHDAAAAQARRLTSEERARAMRILSTIAKRRFAHPPEPDPDWDSGVRVPCGPRPPRFSSGAVVELE